MSRVWPLLIPFVLMGCYSDQKQQLAVCQIQARQQYPADTFVGEQSDHIELCMQARGYEIVEDVCPPYLRLDTLPRPDPDFYSSLSKEQKDRLNLETGKKITTLQGMQRIEPACYEPMGWIGKRLLQIEKRLGFRSET